MTSRTTLTIPKKLRTLFLISVPLFMIHSIEEHWTEFFDVYPLFSAIGQLIGSSADVPFIVFSFLWWLLLLSASFLLLTGRFPCRLMFIPGIIYLYEFHHIIKAILAWDYYPGLITALGFPVIGYFFWKEFLRVLRPNA